MMRFVTPIILIGISIALFFMFANPFYNEISLAKMEIASYDEALNNEKTLESERDKLVAKYNTINVDDLTKIQKLLPSGVDNIRLILEIGKIASPYGMVLKDVKYNATDATASDTSGTIIRGGGAENTPTNYGIFNLEFSTTGSYPNFISFTKDLESNLRIVDISSVSFSSDAGGTGPGAKTSSSDIYTYNFKIKTYWLKN